MRRYFSPALERDLAKMVESALAEHGTVNIPALAEQLRLRHERENIALEDMAELVLRQAQFLGAAMEFYSPDLRR